MIMKVYHMSDTLKLNEEMVLDFKRQDELTTPFVEALEYSKDCYMSMLLNTKYLRAVLGKFNMMDMQTNYTKWACEGAFEYIRKTEFPTSYSRMKSNYFYDNLEDSKRLFEFDWGNESEEERKKIRLFEIELSDEHPKKRDMLLFDEAFDALYSDISKIDFVLDCARKYFNGECTEQPVWEILSDKSAKAVNDITYHIHD